MSRSGAKALREQRERDNPAARADRPAGRRGAARQRSDANPWWAIALFAVLVNILGTVLFLVQDATGPQLVVVQLASLAPALAGLAAWLVARRSQQGHRPLFQTAVGSAQHRAHSVLALAAGIVLVLLLWGLDRHHWTGLGRVASLPFAAFALVQLAAALAEEFGWRGIAQPLLENRMGRVSAGIVLGVFLWVWQLSFLLPGASALAMLVATVCLSVLLGHLGNGSIWQRTLPAALCRWLANLGLFWWPVERSLDDVHAAPFMGATAITMALFLALFVVATRRRRARASRA